MTAPILVTGAAGTTGREIVRLLDEDRVPVRAGVRSLETGAELESRHVEVVEIDLTKPHTLTAAFDGVGAAYLLTPFAPNMVELTANLVTAAMDADVDRLVRHSALGAGEVPPPFAPARWHREAERLVENSGIPSTFIRPTAYMQNLLGSAASINADGIIANPVGEAPISHVDARDVAAVAAATLTTDGHLGETYAVTGPEAITYSRIASILSDVLDRDVGYVEISAAEMRSALQSMGMPDPLVDGFLELQAWFADGLAAAVHPTVEAVTGRRPRTFREFATDYADAFR
ncbi:NAD(P)H-binding protein [Haloferacaceae archaeon DSL9]